MAAIRNFVAGGNTPRGLADFCQGVRTLDRRTQPFVLMKNCPIDRDVPIFDYEEPVESKRALKTTFIAEAFLALYAELVGTPSIGYLNVNDGDVFQDIYPKKDLKDSQSQKALRDIKFHKDLANHFVRPDYVNMLSMRADSANQVYTSFVRNEEAVQRLSDDILAELRRDQFHTPYDDLTVAGGHTDVGEAPSHAVLKDDLDLRFFETRTVGLNDKAQQAVDELVRVLHELKARVLLMPGDFLSEHNNFSIHCKEILRVANEESLKTRWIIKTVNVDRLEDHAKHFLPGRYGIVNG
ncbi:MAG: Fe(II)-2OG oxygenase family protein [Solirubrobacteraceae bacterium]